MWCWSPHRRRKLTMPEKPEVLDAIRKIIKNSPCHWCGSTKRGVRRIVKDPVSLLDVKKSQLPPEYDNVPVLGRQVKLQIMCEVCGAAAPWHRDKEKAARNWVASPKKFQ